MSNHQAGMPFTENSNSRPMSPAFPSTLSSPISSYAPSCPTSASSGSRSSSSTPPTPQSPLLLVLAKGPGGKETISPDTILQHYVNVARRLTENRQNLAASPCPSPGLTSTDASPKKMETIGEPALVLSQAPSRPAALDWPPPQWTLEESLTLDELPDSEAWSLPEYQLTQEWFEQTIRCLNDLEEEKRVEEEIDVDMGPDMDVDTEVDVESRGVRRSR